MKTSNKFRLLILLFLTLGIASNTVIPEICFCEEACSHIFPNRINAKKGLAFHSHCAGSTCKSCNFEDGQMLRAKTASFRAPETTFFYASIFLTTLSVSLLNPSPGDRFTCWVYAGDRIQSTPIYIQNQSFLC